MFKLIIIDLDDTIVNYSYANKIAFDLLMEELYKHTKNSSLSVKHKEIKDKLYIDYDNKFIRHDKLLQLKLLCNDIGIKDFCLIQNLYELYEKTYLDNLSINDECFKFLNSCLDNNLKVCIMTNNLLSIQLKVCNKFGLNKFIDALFTSNEFMFEKPHEDCLNYIINYYGYNKNEILVIGDSIENDIQWGKNNGIKTILCDYFSFCNLNKDFFKLYFI